MPVINRVAELHDEITGWRRELHTKPEILFDVHETAAYVTEKLKAFGCDEVVTGIGRTGVVGIIKGRHGEGQTVGLRADMDALPITEVTGLPYASKTRARCMPAGMMDTWPCCLARRAISAKHGTSAGLLRVIFQPAEEGGGGGREMVQDGMMERFGISSVYGMHNMPGIPAGHFAMRPGPIMAATDEFEIKVTGRGGHAAMPHTTIDPVFIGSQIVSGLQGIVSRNADPLEALVISTTQFHAGTTNNVIPNTATLSGTIRTLKKEMRDFAEARLKQLVPSIAEAHAGRPRSSTTAITP